MNPKTIDEIYSYLKDPNNYKDAVKKRIVKIILGSSVIRVFKEGSKKQLITCLEHIDVDHILTIQSQEEYDRWHIANVNKLYSCLKKEQSNIEKLSAEGLKWGHSTKVFNLFIGHLVMMSPYFAKKKNLNSIRYYLHVPLDSKVFTVLKSCKEDGVPKYIKSVDKNSYCMLQKLLRTVAGKHKIPALYFDEYAWAMVD